MVEHMPCMTEFDSRNQNVKFKHFKTSRRGKKKGGCGETRQIIYTGTLGAP